MAATGRGGAKVNGAACHPVGRMRIFLIHPRPGNPAIALHAGINHIGVYTLFIFEPVHIIISIFLRLVPWHIAVTVIMEIAVMQFHMVKAKIIAQWMDMHLTYALGIVAMAFSAPCHCMG